MNLQRGATITSSAHKGRIRVTVPMGRGGCIGRKIRRDGQLEAREVVVARENILTVQNPLV